MEIRFLNIVLTVQSKSGTGFESVPLAFGVNDYISQRNIAFPSSELLAQRQCLFRSILSTPSIATEASSKRLA